MPNNYVLLERIELNNTAASVTFSNIPQTGYTDLKVVASPRRDSSSGSGSMGIRFNGATTNYSWRRLNGNGSAAGSDNSSVETYINAGEVGNSTNTANTFMSNEIYIPNYTSTTTAKSVSVDGVAENNATTASTNLIAGLWNPGTQAAITTITLLPYSGNFVANSTFSLYGIANSSTTPAIAPKADGGNIIATDGTYWYHAFLSNGTFTPQTALTADVLLVAGGGGGNGSSGGGGGAGGLSYLAGTNLTTTGYTCTIGAGGAVGANNGTNSTFLSIISNGGGYGNNSAGAAGVGGSGGGGGEGAAGASANQGNTGGATGYGNAGGGGTSNPGSSYNHGGGGGAGGVGGSTATANTGGAGGVGLNTWSSWATATGTGVSGYFAGGGGGGTYVGTGGTGGAGGGANGAGASTAATTAVPNTGGGGGGGGSTGAASAGASGILIIRYAVAS